MVFFDRHTHGAFGIRLNEILTIWPSEKNYLFDVVKLEKIMVCQTKILLSSKWKHALDKSCSTINLDFFRQKN